MWTMKTAIKQVPGLCFKPTLATWHNQPNNRYEPRKTQHLWKHLYLNYNEIWCGFPINSGWYQTQCHSYNVLKSTRGQMTNVQMVLSVNCLWHDEWTTDNCNIAQCVCNLSNIVLGIPLWKVTSQIHFLFLCYSKDQCKTNVWGHQPTSWGRATIFLNGNIRIGNTIA